MQISQKIWFETIDSTNDWLKLNYKAFTPNQTLVASAEQTKGRGQFGRSFVSQKGGLYFSLYLKPEIQTGLSEKLILIFSQHLVWFCKSRFSLDLRIKFPNDVYFEDKKLCGVLIDNIFLGSTLEASILGVGLNVNQTFEGRDFSAVGLGSLVQKELDIKDLLDDLIDSLNLEEIL